MPGNALFSITSQYPVISKHPPLNMPDAKPDSNATSATPTCGLAIHTASADLGLAIQPIGAGQQPIRRQTWSIGREVSSYLHLYLSEFIQPQSWQDLAFLAVARGPGGFTGTRLGVVTARTLAEQLNLPLFAISTLAAAVWQSVWPVSQEISQEARQEISPAQTTVPIAPSEIITVTKTIAITMPAHRSEVYGAIYEVAATGLTARLPDTVMPLAQWQQLIEQQPPDRLIQTDRDWGSELGFTVSAVLDLARLSWQQGERPHWSAALPFYGQSPVA